MMSSRNIFFFYLENIPSGGRLFPKSKNDMWGGRLFPKRLFISQVKNDELSEYIFSFISKIYLCTLIR